MDIYIDRSYTEGNKDPKKIRKLAKLEKGKRRKYKTWVQLKLL